MTRLVVSDAKPWHCGQMARTIRKAHRDALEPTGTDVHAELRAIYSASSFCRVAHLDGVLMALGGVASTLASGMGFVWLALSEAALAHPGRLAREARHQLAEIMETHSELATTILADDDAALRFALYLGFHVSHEEELNRRDLAVNLRRDASHHIPIGRTFVIPLGYHGHAGIL